MTDREMIAQCKKGDREAFNELILKYQKQVFGIAYGMLSDYEDASDAAQEVFVNVYRSISSFREQASFTTWLYRICRNVCSDMLRKRQRRGPQLSLDNDDDDDPLMNTASDAPGPAEVYEQTERQAAVRQALDTLKTDYKEVIVYCDMQGMSYEEAAVILKCPVGTVKSRLNRARNALRKKLSEKRELFRF